MPNATTIEKNDKNETDQEKLNVRRIIAGAEVYYNFTGKLKCLDMKDQDQIGADMWDYQVQTERSFKTRAKLGFIFYSFIPNTFIIYI